ncbi:rRNA-processing protein CGR1 [Trichuris trichiura]|uniref:rRNA-processing protein CGR1 n=1 Tax=Trichuris trichiura TaxID=36087 RepID=A0A077Z7P0_TRITR|nr:rRNA-processing protein CGR1 [Trichuris trichiura]
MSSSTPEASRKDAETSERLDAWNRWHSAFKSIHHRRANKQDIARAPLTIRRLHSQLFDQHKFGKGESRSFKLKSAFVPKALLAKPVRRYLQEEASQSSSDLPQSLTAATAACENSNVVVEVSREEKGSTPNFDAVRYEQDFIFPFEFSRKDDMLSRYSSLSRICFQCSNEEESDLPNVDKCSDEDQLSPVEEDIEKPITKMRRKARSNNNYRKLQLKKKKYVVQKKKKKLSTAVRLRKWQGAFTIY